MKKEKKEFKKLFLNKETIVRLNSFSLSNIVGGSAQVPHPQDPRHRPIDTMVGGTSGPTG